VKWYRLNTQEPGEVSKDDKAVFDRKLDHVARSRNKAAGVKFAVEQDTALQDFYSKWNRFAVSDEDKAKYNELYSSLSPEEKKLYDSKKNFYEVSFSNVGGLVMPLIIEWTYADGSKETERISAYIWRKDEYHVTKVFAKDKEVVSVKLDPQRETADIDEANNNWPRVSLPSKFELFRQQERPRGSSTGNNPMQQAKTAGSK
jgi:hypothetical protein